MALEFFRHSFALTPNDGADLAARPSAVFVGTTGDLKVELSKDGVGQFTILKNIPSGTIVPIQPRKIYATGTTATNLIGLT